MAEMFTELRKKWSPEAAEAWGELEPALEFEPEIDGRYGDNGDGMECVALRDGTVIIAISQEHAVDSYSSMFTCDFRMTREQAEKMAEWLKVLING